MIINCNKIFWVFLVVLSTQSYSQQGENFEITKPTIDGGGGLSSGGSFSVGGSVGQTEASAEISGGSYTLSGGFWSSRVNNDFIFKNGFE